MQFGLFGSAAARRGGPEFDSSEGFRDFIEYNIEAEALGFHSTFVVEHHFTGYGQVSATLNLLTWLGARTRWLRLGTAVIVLPWHNPVLLAEQAATLDLLSGGRLDFGIGKGYRYNEFAGFCVPMEEADARFDEALGVILKAWTADAPFSHRGKYWQFDNIVVEPPTAQRPYPPIWMGAGSESEKDHLEPAVGSRMVRASGSAAAQRAAIAQNPCAPKCSKIGPQASVSRAVATPMPTVP
jgi:alkanesulfonate monooxygenase SsuD/methylene tetrahydromethanopterin reductase-like flavin-dependent oxidoreductase (luciferase family)